MGRGLRTALALLAATAFAQAQTAAAPAAAMRTASNPAAASVITVPTAAGGTPGDKELDELDRLLDDRGRVIGVTLKSGEKVYGDAVIAADGAYSFTPNTNWNGDMPQASYTTNTGSSSTLDIKVTPVDDASVLTADSQTVAEDNKVTGNVLTNDSDVDNTLSVVSFTVGGTTYTAGQSATVAGVGAGSSTSDAALEVKLTIARLQDRVAAAQSDAAMARAEVLAKVLAAKLQLEFALFDFRLHQEFDPAKPEEYIKSFAINKMG